MTDKGKYIPPVVCEAGNNFDVEVKAIEVNGMFRADEVRVHVAKSE